MSIRAEYEKVARCKAVVRSGKQCSREAIYFHMDGRGYCSTHHNKIYEDKKNADAKATLGKP